jgi:hypothetical protein
MVKPKKIMISRPTIARYSIELPNGKALELSRKNPYYITDDPEVIEFCANQKGLALGDLSDKEFITYAEKALYNQETVRNRNVKLEDVIGLQWSTEEEEMVVDKLKKLGYICYPNKEKKEEMEKESSPENKKE